MVDKKPASRRRAGKAEEIELDPDVWPRFERFIRDIAKAGPEHRKSKLETKRAKKVTVVLVAFLCASGLALQIRATEAMTIAEKICVFESLRKLPAAEGVKVIGASAIPAALTPAEKAAGADGEKMFIELDIEMAGQPATVRFLCATTSTFTSSQMMGIVK